MTDQQIIAKIRQTYFLSKPVPKCNKKFIDELDKRVRENTKGKYTIFDNEGRLHLVNAKDHEYVVIDIMFVSSLPFDLLRLKAFPCA